MDGVTACISKINSICGIYKITSPSGKVYIGLSYDIKRRFREYRRLDCKRQVKLYNSFIKYGLDRHEFKIIHVCEEHELNKLEKYYVDLYNSFNSQYGLNLRDGGGQNGRLSEETKKKLSIGRMGNKHHNYGKNLSKEWREKISAGNKGRKMSESVKDNLRKIHTGKKLSDEQKQAISKFHTGRMGQLCHNSIPIIQYSLSGEIIKRWDCAIEVTRGLGINQRNITSVCRKRRLTAGGFYWRYESEAGQPIIILKKGHRKRKPIIQLDKNDNIIKEWDSAKSAAEGLNIRAGNISHCLRKVIPSAYGFKWKYA